MSRFAGAEKEWEPNAVPFRTPTSSSTGCLTPCRPGPLFRRRRHRFPDQLPGPRRLCMPRAVSAAVRSRRCSKVICRGADIFPKLLARACEGCDENVRRKVPMPRDGDYEWFEGSPLLGTGRRHSLPRGGRLHEHAGAQGYRGGASDCRSRPGRTERPAEKRFPDQQDSGRGAREDSRTLPQGGLFHAEETGPLDLQGRWPNPSAEPFGSFGSGPGVRFTLRREASRKTN